MVAKSLRFIVMSVLLSCVVPGALLATTITVRQDGTGDFTTISAAVTAAAPADMIDVGPGTYAESITIDKSLTIIGSSGSAVTILDGQHAFRLLRIVGTITVHLEGLTITRGFNHAMGSGAGMSIIQGAAVSVTGCEFTDNHSSYDGGGFIVAGPGTRAVVSECRFEGNSAVHNAGACNVIQGATLTVTDCLFADNHCDDISGALSNNNSVMDVTGCLFTGNTATNVSGAIYYFEAFGTIASCTFYDNSSADDFYATIVMNSSPATTVTHCIISNDPNSYELYYRFDKGYHACNVFWNNALGPIAGDVLAPTDALADPRFCSPMTGNFYLAEDSPAAPGYNDCGALLGAFPVACGPVPVENTTWGRIKSAYKDDSTNQ
jgi:nitrous oxidase accessory protein NosD